MAALVNYFGQHTLLMVGGQRVELEPVPDLGEYRDVVSRGAGGIWQTHAARVPGVVVGDDGVFSRLCLVLSMATGNRVDFYDVTLEHVQPDELHLRSPILRRAVPTWPALRGLLDEQALCEAVVRLDAARFERAREFANAYLDATAGGAFLETRALVAAAALDRLLADLMPPPEGPMLEIAGALRAAAVTAAEQKAAELGVAKEQADELVGSMGGLLARFGWLGYRRLLASALSTFAICESDEEGGDLARKVAASRRELAHNIQFAPAREAGERHEQFQRLVWVYLALLARFVGYEGSFGGAP